MFTQTVRRALVVGLLVVLYINPTYTQSLPSNMFWYNQHLFNNYFSDYRKDTIDFAAANNMGGNRIAIWPHQLQPNPDSPVLDPTLTDELEKQIDYVNAKGQGVYLIEMPFYPKHWTGFPRNSQFCYNGVCTSADVTWRCLPGNGTPHESWKDPDCSKGGDDFPVDLVQKDRFTRAIVERFKHKIQYIGFANEPFFHEHDGTRVFFQSTPDHLIRVLKQGFEITKSINPAIKTVCPDEDDPDSLEILFQKGMSQYCDVIGVHAYPWVQLDAFKTLLRKYEPIMRKYAPDKEVFLTELGDYDNPILAHIWAQMLTEVRKYPRITKIFPISLMDDVATPGAKLSGLVRRDGSPKDAWHVFRGFMDTYTLPLRVPVNTELPGSSYFPDLSGKEGFQDYVLIQCKTSHACPVLVTVTYNDNSGASKIIDVYQRYTFEVHVDPLTSGRDVSVAIQPLNASDAEHVYAEHSRYSGPAWRSGTNTGSAELFEVQQFAEGVVGGGFVTSLAVYNPHSEPVIANFKFVDQNQNVFLRSSRIPGPGRVKFRVNDTLPGYVGPISTEITGQFADGRTASLAAEREVVWWDDRREGHAATGLVPATRWWASEGHKGSFATYVLIANLNQIAADVTIRFLHADGRDYPVRISIPANSRWTQVAPDEMPTGGFGYEVVSNNNVPVSVERAMYWGEGWEGGHVAPASSRLSNEWSFAEGTTGGSFQTFILLANPGNAHAAVTLTFRMDSGEVIDHAVSVPANGRLTVPVDSLGGMDNRTFSTSLRSSHHIVAERAMYWGEIDPVSGLWKAGHASLGQPR